MMRNLLLVLAIVVAGTSVWLVRRRHVDQVTIRTHFHNAQGLKPDAKVRANGLEVGEVKDVSLDPRLGEQPVEVLLRLDPRYAARIPNDSTAAIETDGVLGPPYVEIDVSKATGAPIANNGILRSVDADTSSVQVFQGFLNAIAEQSKKLADEVEKQRQTIDSQNSRTKKRTPKPAEPN
jgi:ABC-type transporter Mla subunit MlaD